MVTENWTHTPDLVLYPAPPGHVHSFLPRTLLVRGASTPTELLSRHIWLDHTRSRGVPSMFIDVIGR